MDNEYIKLTKKELEIMRIFWNVDEALTAVEVLKYTQNTATSIYTVQNTLKSLLLKKAIEVSSYIRVFKTSARKYRPLISANDYAIMQFVHNLSANEKFQLPHLVSTLLKVEHEKDEMEAINELEKMLEVRKTELKERFQVVTHDNDLEHSNDDNI